MGEREALRSVTSTTSWALVGRTDELAALVAALDDDDVRGVVLVGPGGVGKTRLATELVAVGEAADYATVRVSATRSSAELPLGAFAPLLPELGGSGVDLLAGARRALAERRAGRRLLLFVDDAHVLDDVSATLLLHLSDDADVFLVVTVRQGEAVPDAVTALWKDGRARRLDLAAMPDDDVAALAATMLGGPVDDATTARLSSLAVGNPLTLRELVLGAVEAGALSSSDGRWRAQQELPVSPRLVELVEDRIGKLADDERFALELVALGEPLGAEQLVALVPDAVVARLERRALVELRTDGRRVEAWLSHPLHGEVVRAQLGVLRRRSVLAALAGSVSRAGTRRRGDVLRLATWRLELGDDDPELFLAAARQAYVALDLERAVALAAAAWQGEPTVAAGHLLGALRTQLGRHEEADEVLASVAALADADGDDRSRAMVALSRSENLFRMDRYDDAVAVVSAAEASVAAPWCDELAGHRATLVLLHGRPVEAERIVTPLLASDDVRVFVEAAIAGATVAAYDARPLDALDLARRAFAVHLGIWEQELLMSDPSVHVFSELLALTQAGLLADAESLATGLHAQAVEAQRGLSMAALALQLGLVHIEQGRLRTALGWVQRSADLYSAHGPVQRRRFAVAAVLLAASCLGEVDVARAAQDELDGDGPRALWFTHPAELVARSWLACASGHPAEAQALLADAVAAGVDAGERSSACMAVHAMARQGRAPEAAAFVPALAPVAQGELLTARLDHVVALAAGDADGLAAVAQRFVLMGAMLYGAEAMADASRARQRAGQAREARLLAQHARKLAAACEGAATPALAVDDSVVPLSKREREVALLAAGGLAAKEIAARLFLSPRTVENHLQRAYEKLGASCRADLSVAFGLAGE